MVSRNYIKVNLVFTAMFRLKGKKILEVIDNMEYVKLKEKICG